MLYSRRKLLLRSYQVPKTDIEISFTYEKDTKGTHRYKEDSENPYIGSLYIQKKKIPIVFKTISITLHLD